MTEPIRVLHVDDDPDLADLVATYLEREDDRLDVVTETSVTDGLEKLAREDVDCIVSDYEIPGRNGLDFLRAVREDDPSLPFILYTGKGSEDIASEAISAGVTDYLQKESGTSQYAVLANRITNAVEQLRATRAAEKTEEKLGQLADKSDDVHFMFTGDWSELLFVNSVYEEIWGAPISEVEENPSAFLEYVHPDDRERVKRSMRTLSEGEPDEIEYRVLADDETRWVRAQGKPIFDNEGTVERIVGFVRDVTDRKEREAELERIERQYEAVFHDPNILACVLEPDGSVRDVNETALEYIESDRDDVLGEPFWETPWWGQDEHARREIEDWVDRASDGEYVEFEANLVGSDGQRTVRGVFRPVTTADGEVESIIVSDRDVTERKEHERELERTWGRVAFLLRATDSGIWEWNPDDGLEHHGVARLFGVSAEEGESDPTIEDVLVHVHPEDRERVEAHFERLRMEQESDRVEFRVQPNDGEVRWLEDHAVIRSRSEETNEVIGLLTDITGRKQRERAIEELHETAGEVWEAESPEAVADIVVNAASEILGMSFTAIYLHDADEDHLVPVASTNQTLDLIGELPTFEPGDGLAWEVFETGDPLVFEDVSAHPDRINEETPVRGEIILPLSDHGVLLVGSPEPSVFDDTDTSLMQTLVTHATTALDQLERERRLTALQRRTQRLMHTPTEEATAEVAVEAAYEILDSPSSGVHLVDEGGTSLEPVAAVDTIRESFEPPTYKREAEDDPVSLIVWEAFEGQESVVIDDVGQDTRAPEDSLVGSAIIHPLADHGIFVVTAAEANAFDETDKTFIEIVATSLTVALDRVDRETHLQERERALERQNERLDDFASLVSHDLRNPLNVVQGRVDLAREECDSEHLAPAAAALDRSLALIDDLLTLAREGKAVSDLEPVELASVVEDCWDAVETGDGRLKVEVDQTIEADQSRLQQLLENLFRNAVEHGGDNVVVTVGAMAGGFYVADDGPGIPDDKQDEVFEPGYSTGESGTGFGLNIVMEIVEAHGWEIRVTNSSDGGARFEITGVEGE